MLAIKPLDYEILRGVPVGNPEGLPHRRKPMLIASLLDEAKFKRTGLLTHRDSAYIEERGHTWFFHEALAKLCYFSRKVLVGDVVVVYSFEQTQCPGSLPAAA